MATGIPTGFYCPQHACHIAQCDGSPHFHYQPLVRFAHDRLAQTILFGRRVSKLDLDCSEMLASIDCEQGYPSFLCEDGSLAPDRGWVK